jgi:hypothetical protein
MRLRAFRKGFFGVRPGQYMHTGFICLCWTTGECGLRGGGGWRTGMRGVAAEIRQAAENTGAEVAEVARTTATLLAA